ncbi:MAG: carboxypeptidase regulatory-like domain-containing protein [Desulfotomaculaceae bacterium]|nr:carboxypeptidase regulatory-like domain-containing protein [Desulfotomaculaceae bacterium]
MKKASSMLLVTLIFLILMCITGVAWADILNNDTNTNIKLNSFECTIECPERCPCTNTLEIYVYDMNTRLPISQATVEISGPGSYFVKDYTGSKGTSSISKGINLAGEYFVSASKEGYKSRSKPVTIKECSIYEVSIGLIPECPEPAISVYVYDNRTDDPIGGAEVTLNGPDDYSSTKTTAGDGKITFDNLTKGTYAVSVSKSGYENGADSVNAIECSQSDLSIGLDPSSEPCPDPSISVYVYDNRTDDPIVGAEVTLNGPDDYSSTRTTANDGKTIFDNLSEGTYAVSVSKSGYRNGSLSESVSATYCKPYEMLIGLTKRNSHGGGDNGNGGDNGDNGNNPPTTQTPPPDVNETPPTTQTPPDVNETPPTKISGPPPIVSEPPTDDNQPPGKGDLPFTGANPTTYLLTGLVVISIGVITRRLAIK